MDKDPIQKVEKEKKKGLKAFLWILLVLIIGAGAYFAVSYLLPKEEGRGLSSYDPVVARSGTALYATIDGLNVRAKADPDEDAFYQIGLHEEVTFLGKVSSKTATYILREYQYTTNFLYVELANGQKGWAYAAALSTNSTEEMPYIYDFEHLSGVIVDYEDTEWGTIGVNRYGEYVTEDPLLFYSILTNAVANEDMETLAKLCYGDIYDEFNTDSTQNRYPQSGWETRDDFNKPILNGISWYGIKSVVLYTGEIPGFVREFIDTKEGDNESQNFWNTLTGIYEGDAVRTLDVNNRDFNGWAIYELGVGRYYSGT